jgi:hypothetical protein
MIVLSGFSTLVGWITRTVAGITLFVWLAAFLAMHYGWVDQVSAAYVRPLMIGLLSIGLMSLLIAIVFAILRVAAREA